jgi:hypothetical protein
MTESGEVLTYRELANHLTAGMSRRNRPAVKTYLVEPVRPIRAQDTANFLRRSLKAASPRRRVDVRPLPDMPTINRVGIGRVTLWIETGESRFWEVHTLDETATVNRIVDRWIAITPEIDAPWFPQELLGEAARTGEFVGFGLTYTRAFFADDPDTAESLTVRVSGTDSRDALSGLQSQAVFARTSALSMVRVRNPFTGPGATQTGRVTASITARGRVSSRGDDFERHRTFFRYCADVYRAAEARIQEAFTVGQLGPDGEGLRGPAVISLGSPVDDLGAFCGRVFSGGDPFRLWGFLERRSADLIVANTFDRRSGGSFTVEATPSEWRVYLPSGAPGAVILRLVTLLQQNHDRRAGMPGLAVR